MYMYIENTKALFPKGFVRLSTPPGPALLGPLVRSVQKNSKNFKSSRTITIHTHTQRQTHAQSGSKGAVRVSRHVLVNVTPFAIICHNYIFHSAEQIAPTVQNCFFFFL